MSLESITVQRSQTPASGKVSRGMSWKADYLPIAGLLLLSLVPVLAGLLRLFQLATGAEVTSANARFFAQPLPVLIHIVTVSFYALIGAFQFSPGIRRRFLNWHRRMGRLLVVCGLMAATSGLWMSVFYPLPESDGRLLMGIRLLFGSGMVMALILGVLSVLRRDLTRHRAWMIRAYAIGMGAGTQVFTHLPWMLLVGMPGEWSRAGLMAAGWMINVLIAEWIINRSSKAVKQRCGDSVPLLS